MNDTLWLIAFIFAPMAAIAVGYAAVRLHERSTRQHPAE